MEYIKNRFYEKCMKNMADLQRLRKNMEYSSWSGNYW